MIHLINSISTLNDAVKRKNNIREHCLTDERNEVKAVKYFSTIRDGGFTFKRLANITEQMRCTCNETAMNISPRTHFQINDGHK